jgi:hypothetical protein
MEVDALSRSPKFNGNGCAHAYERSDGQTDTTACLQSLNVLTYPVA